MRRGHAGIGGWRNENPRNFKPRGGAVPPFRPSRGYPIQESSRYPQLGPRLPRGTFTGRPSLLDNPSPQKPHDFHERNKYRHDSRPSYQYRHQDRNPHQGARSIYPILDRMRHESKDQSKNQEKMYYDKPSNDNYHLNSMGDIDDRQINYINNQDQYGRHPISPWINPHDNRRQHFDDRNINQSYRHENPDSNKIPVLEYSGHRPPSSDHYGGNPSSTLDNSNSFSRSVDDTVDIIRRRLQNRNEIPPNETSEGQSGGNQDIDDRVPPSMVSNHQNVPQSQPVRKRIQRQKQNIEANCDKMKNKIVHELFKMDKDKIHKLMDNPKSSSKFEYALSSFITESQNSLNRHLRSVAEKSLYTSEDFVHNDNNTIYEDTFMKQMQGVLDPQDTILLEDIKPLVLAELSKVLQLNEYDQPFQMVEQPEICETNNEKYDPTIYGNNSQDYYDQINSPQNVYETFDNDHFVDDFYNFEYTSLEPGKSEPLFERRPTKKNVERLESRLSTESQKSLRTSFEGTSSKQNCPVSEKRRHSNNFDKKPSEERETLPLFDSNAEQLSEEDDPFAELDKQYHVAVDHNFIETYDISSPQQSTSEELIKKNNAKSSSNSETDNIKQEIDSQLHDIAQSPLKRAFISTMKDKSEKINMSLTSCSSGQEIQVKKECHTDHIDQGTPLNVNIKQEYNVNSSKEKVTTENIENINTPTKSLPSNARKRSIDQKPSHRKEKRKKSDSTIADPGKQNLNKNIIINVNDCNSSDTEKCKDAAKSILNLFFSKDNDPKEVPQEKNQIESIENPYSEKYVKRKEAQKKNENEGDKKKRQRSISSSHSIVCPKENLNNNSQTIKSESKTKLQSIDMFLEQPRKVTQVHQAHRNTNTPIKSIEIVKPKTPVITFNKKITKKHISTQVSRKTQSKETQTLVNRTNNTKFSQTERKNLISRSVQTDPVRFEKSGIKATDTFERMKQIDLEIQVLLQEKFKLYNSIESSDPCPSRIESLGMTVVNVTPDDEIKDNDVNEVEVLSGDDIVEDFTSIPVEELEQIALETIQDEQKNKKQNKKNRRQKILDESRASSSSPTTRRNAKKTNTPNISLLEQIITDDRPLEDIISLDDLETTPVKSKKQKKVQSVPKKKLKKTKAAKPSISVTDYELKECYVVLTRDDLSEYYKHQSESVDLEDYDESAPLSVEIIEETPIEDVSIIVEETVTNDLQFDMLDVSEDIVIGDNCEIKSNEDKDMERPSVVITEEIILDNSQSHELSQSEINLPDNICKMYDYSTDENLRRDTVVVSGHADAVLAIECVENNFIAACLDGNVYHFGADGQLITTLRGSNLAVTCLTIVKEKYGTTVYTGSLDSRIRYYDLDTGLEKGPECNVLSPIQTMDRAWDTIFVGTRTGFVLQFECKNNMLIPVSTVKFSEQSILALRAMKEGPRKVLLVAARSEDVTIKDAQTGLLLRTLVGPKMTVYTLLYEDGKIYCGTSSHQIHVFDYASGCHIGAHEGGKGAVCLRAAGGLIFAGCYDGCVYVYRDSGPRPLAQLRGPGLMLLSLAVVDTRIIAGYKDRSLYIWKIPLGIQQEMIL
ncbi:unnamed protein product [Chilo suppressalis]|uniref:Zinc finger protein 106 n=1 Tax=Chilo suppressalis TaxID=168631 RepID=A0ABN8AVY4_CHISP|nr:unnamed protein product [Chilo suppressalis]